MLKRREPDYGSLGVLSFAFCFVVPYVVLDINSKTGEFLILWCARASIVQRAEPLVW